MFDLIDAPICTPKKEVEEKNGHRQALGMNIWQDERGKDWLNTCLSCQCTPAASWG